jgi:NAD(P)-dependent dehydrogenase (short-subunit alcohol dehydrogenase family)
MLNLLQEREIRVNCIAPGLIDGPMQQKSVATRGGEQVWKCQIMRRGTPFEVGSLITWLLCDSSKYITGTVQVRVLFSAITLKLTRNRSLMVVGCVKKIILSLVAR